VPKNTCTHQFADGEWNGCGNEGVLVDTLDGVRVYRCAEHFPEWLAEQFRYKLKTHKRLAHIVRMFKAENIPPDILERIEKDELA
jgi:hypothetical protein